MSNKKEATKLAIMSMALTLGSDFIKPKKKKVKKLKMQLSEEQLSIMDNLSFKEKKKFLKNLKK